MYPLASKATLQANIDDIDSRTVHVKPILKNTSVESTRAYYVGISWYIIWSSDSIDAIEEAAVNLVQCSTYLTLLLTIGPSWPVHSQCKILC